MYKRQTEDSFTEEEFEALTKTTVYQSDESPTGYKVTFRFYGPEYETCLLYTSRCV